MEFNKTQWNDLFNVVVSQGLSPDMFERLSQPGNNQYRVRAASGIRLKSNEKLSFVCEMSNETFYYHYYPNGQNVSHSYNTSRWKEVLVNADEWAKAVKTELEAPDLWKAAENVGDAWKRINWGGGEDDHFTAPELIRIYAALEETKHIIAHQLGLNPGQIKYANEKIEELSGEAPKIKRGLFISALLGILIQIIVPIQPAQDKFYAILSQVGQKVADCIIETTPKKPPRALPMQYEK